MSAPPPTSRQPSDISLPPPIADDERAVLVSDEDAAVAFSPLLKSMFATLRELYVYCEANGRADIGGEVVDALSMCRQDFSVLVERLNTGEKAAAPAAVTCGELSPSRRATEGGDGASLSSGGALAAGSEAAGTGSTAVGGPGSPLLSVSSPLAQLNSPESNSRMLVALEALELEELQEAATYFEQTSAPGKELLPRREHERLFLERAAAEGREPAAKRFLITLNRMAMSAQVRTTPCTMYPVPRAMPPARCYTAMHGRAHL